MSVVLLRINIFFQFPSAQPHCRPTSQSHPPWALVLLHKTLLFKVRAHNSKTGTREKLMAACHLETLQTQSIHSVKVTLNDTNQVETSPESYTYLIHKPDGTTANTTRNGSRHNKLWKTHLGHHKSHLRDHWRNPIYVIMLLVTWSLHTSTQELQMMKGNHHTSHISVTKGYNTEW